MANLNFIRNNGCNNLFEDLFRNLTLRFEHLDSSIEFNDLLHLLVKLDLQRFDHSCLVLTLGLVSAHLHLLVAVEIDLQLIALVSVKIDLLVHHVELSYGVHDLLVKMLEGSVLLLNKPVFVEINFAIVVGLLVLVELICYADQFGDV